MRNVLLASMLAAALGGCAEEHGRGGGGVDIRGDSPEEAADEVAEAVCDWTARCGEPSVECDGSSSGDLTCTGTIEEVSFAECYGDIHPEVLADLRCRELTSEQARLVNDCINGMVSQDCVTMAEIEEQASIIEAGGEPPDLREIPPECELLEDVFTGCPDP